MDKLRVAVIGVGFWGKNHARVYSEIEGVELAAAVDPDRSACEAVASKYGCKCYASVEEMLEKEKIDAASVCTPSVLHGEVASKLIDKGVSTLVEKPFTATLSEGLVLYEKIRQKRVHVSVGFIERFNPAVTHIKNLIKQGKLGDVILFYSKRVSSWPVRIGDVGVIKDLSIHDLDLARYLLGSDALSIYAVSGFSNTRVKQEDYANILLRFPKATAFVESNWLTPYKERLLVITGSQATATANYLTQEVSLSNVEGKFIPTIKPQEPLRLELENFVKSIRTSEQLCASVEDGLKALSLAEAALRSAKLGNSVTPPF
ncbi:MAG: Gfo/Idh/MocA family oxidoreductase [Thermoprotei archaeon]